MTTPDGGDVADDIAAIFNSYAGGTPYAVVAPTENEVILRLPAAYADFNSHAERRDICCPDDPFQVVVRLADEQAAYDEAKMLIRCARDIARAPLN
jgi:hypothetical protein